MINVTLFGGNAIEFDKTAAVLDKLHTEYDFQVYQINIHNDPVVLEKYNGKTPVIIIGPYTLTNPINEKDLRIALGAAADREKQLGDSQSGHDVQKIQKGKKITRSDRYAYWLSQHYMFLINAFLFLYVGLPFLAPVFMKTGVILPAKAIYSVYSISCHELAFRSWFLFGEQVYYPRALAGIPDVLTYEQISGENTIDVLKAREFVGNDAVGYKVALCERDVAIWGTMLIFGLLFSVTKNRIKPIRWYVWLFVGLVPIGLDGGSQLPALMNHVPSWLFIRESTPLLRTITGMLFGLTTAWYLFPLIEMSMRETREILFRKISIHGQKKEAGV